MNPSSGKRSWWLTVSAIVAVAFGALTVLSGGSVLFGPDDAQRAAGAYVGFVVWFNFIAGFAYVAAGLGLWTQQRWAAVVTFLLALATLLVFAALGVHIAGGGAYEMRTVGALVFRSLVWLAISWVAYRMICARGGAVAPGA